MPWRGVALLLQPVLDVMRSWGPEWARRFEMLVLAVAAVLGVADAFSQCSLYGLSSAAFPPIYTQALLMGVSICGSLITVTRMCFKWAFGDHSHSSYAFFLFAAAYSVGSAALYWYVRRRNTLFRARLIAAIETSPTLAIRAYETSPKGTVRKPRHDEYFSAQVVDLLCYSPKSRVGETCLMLIFVHAQFTAVVPSIVGLTHDFWGTGWYQVFAIFAYNVGDLCGRGPLATYLPCPVGYRWGAILLRCVLVVAICLCVPPYPLSGSPIPLLCVIVPFGGSTGYLASSIMAGATDHVSAKDREATGYLGILSIFAGLILGSALAFPLKEFVQPGL